MGTEILLNVAPSANFCGKSVDWSSTGKAMNCVSLLLAFSKGITASSNIQLLLQFSSILFHFIFSSLTPLLPPHLRLPGQQKSKNNWSSPLRAKPTTWQPERSAFESPNISSLLQCACLVRAHAHAHTQRRGKLLAYSAELCIATPKTFQGVQNLGTFT